MQDEVGAPQALTGCDWCWQEAGKKSPDYPLVVIGGIAIPSFVGLVILASILEEPIILLAMDALLSLCLLAFGGIVLGLEFYCVTLTTNRVTSLMATPHWELVKITPVGAKRILGQLFVIIHQRCWNIVIVEMVIKAVSVVSFLVALFRLNDVVSFQRDEFRPIVMVLGISIGLLTVIALSVESRLRMEAITALSIYVASHISQPAFATLAGLAAVFMMHALQVSTLIVPFLIISRGNPNENWDVLYLTIVWPLLVLWSYRLLRDWSLDSVQHDLFRAV